MRRGFTLIELLTIVAIIAIMVTVAVTSVGSGQKIARIRGATRDVYATIRQARSVALVTQQSSVLTYSTIKKDGEICASVVLDSVRLMSNQTSGRVKTLSGEEVDISNPNGFEQSDRSSKKNSDNSLEDTITEEDGGESIEEILFAPVDEEVFRGIAIKVVLDEDDNENEDVKRVTASAFSNADSLVGKYKAAKESAKKAEVKNNGDDEVDDTSEIQEPVRVAWEPNGRCQPHRVWIYPSGSDPDSGLLIRVDRFGAAKVISQEEDY